MSHETSSSYQLSPMAEHPDHGGSEGTAAGLSEGDMGSYGGKIVISRSASMSPRTLARRQQERHDQYGSSGSDLRSLGGLSEGPDVGIGGGGGWDGRRPWRMASGYSEARLTSASTLTSFNEESTAGSPGAGARVCACVCECGFCGVGVTLSLPDTSAFYGGLALEAQALLNGGRSWTRLRDNSHVDESRE